MAAGTAASSDFQGPVRL